MMVHSPARYNGLMKNNGEGIIRIWVERHEIWVPGIRNGVCDDLNEKQRPMYPARRDKTVYDNSPISCHEEYNVLGERCS